MSTLWFLVKEEKRKIEVGNRRTTDYFVSSRTSQRSEAASAKSIAAEEGLLPERAQSEFEVAAPGLGRSLHTSSRLPAPAR